MERIALERLHKNMFDDSEIMDSVFFYARIRSRFFYNYEEAKYFADKINDPDNLHPQSDAVEALVYIGEAQALAKILDVETNYLFFDPGENLQRLQDLKQKVKTDMWERNADYYKAVAKLRMEGDSPEASAETNEEKEKK